VPGKNKKKEEWRSTVDEFRRVREGRRRKEKKKEKANCARAPTIEEALSMLTPEQNRTRGKAAPFMWERVGELSCPREGGKKMTNTKKDSPSFSPRRRKERGGKKPISRPG